MNMMYKMTKNFIKKFSVIVLIFLILGCAGSKEAQIDSSYRTPEFDISDLDIDSQKELSSAKGLTGHGRSDNNKSDTDIVSEQTKVIIYNARFNIETDNLEKTSKEISAIAPVYSGYIVSAGNYRVVFRIPSDKFESAIKDLEKIKGITSKNIYSEDVTDAYRDTELRLDSKIKARDRYLDLLKRAENVTAALSVERELERLNGEIEAMKGKLKQLSHLARYSTITVSIEEETKPGPIGYIFMYTWKGIKWLFVRN